MTGRQSIEINAQPRTQGKHWSRSLRSGKLIPAVVYGPKIGNLNIAIPEGEMVKYNKSEYENKIFKLKSPDKKVDGLQVLKKDTSIHPGSRRLLHVDFYAVDMTSTVRVFVELRYVGRAAGLGEGGVRQDIRRDIEIECLPADIPSHFEVDVTELGLGDVLHVSDVKVPPGVKVITHGEEAIVTVSEIKEEVITPTVTAAATAEAPAAGAPAAPGAAPAAASAAAAPAAGAGKGKKE